MYTIYAFGNGYLLYGMFQAIALFFKNNNIGVLFTILAMIAAIYYAIRVTIYHQHSLLSTAKYVIVFSIILTGLVYNQTTVIINDVSNPGAPTNAQPISNVPWGIAALWSDFTTIQYGLAEDFTNDFSVPAGDNMLSEGLGVSIIQQADSATISTSNSYLYQDYNQYISNCVAPGISAGYLDVSELLGAGDATDTASQTYSSNAANSIWTVMSAYTNGFGANILTTWYSGSSSTSVTETASGQSDPGGTTVTCSQETAWLQTAVQDYITNNAGPAIAGGLQMASFSDLSNAIGAVNPYIFNMQQGGQAQLMQAIGVNMYAPAILKMAQASGSNASSLAVATGTGEVSTQTGMMESGILAGQYMPIVFGIFEAILLGASVIIFILILTHMGVSYLKLLFQLMIMITIWPSLTAIFNYITQLIIQAKYLPIAGLGYSVSGSGTVNAFLAESLSWMGYFSWSVPMVAYMIASGSSYAVTSVVGGMDSATSKNASVRGADAGMGNMTAGQIKDNNYLANATNVTHTQNTGAKAPHESTSGLGIEKTAETSGSFATKAGTAHWQMDTTTLGGKIISETYHEEIGGSKLTAGSTDGKMFTVTQATGAFSMDTNKTLEATTLKSYETTKGQITTDTQSVVNSKSALTSAIFNKTSGQGINNGSGPSATKGAGNNHVIVDKNAATNKKSDTNESSVKVKTTIQAGIKTPTGSPIGGGASVQVVSTAGTQWADTNANTHAYENANSTQANGNIIDGHTAQWWAENGQTSAIRSDASNLLKNEKKLSLEEKKMAQLSNKLTQLKKQGASGGINLAPAYLNFLANGSLSSIQSNFASLVFDSGKGIMPKGEMQFVNSYSGYNAQGIKISRDGLSVSNSTANLSPENVNTTYKKDELKYQEMLNANNGYYSSMSSKNRAGYESFVGSANIGQDYLNFMQKHGGTLGVLNEYNSGKYSLGPSSVNRKEIVSAINSYETMKNSKIVGGIVKQNHVAPPGSPTAAPDPYNPIFNKHHSTSGSGYEPPSGNVSGYPGFIQANPTSNIVSSTNNTGLTGSSGSKSPRNTSFGIPTETQQPTIVKGGNIEQIKGGGGTSTPYTMGTWIGGQSSVSPSATLKDNGASGTGYEPPRENVSGSNSGSSPFTSGSPSGNQGSNTSGTPSATVKDNGASGTGYEPPNNNSIPTP